MHIHTCFLTSEVFVMLYPYIKAEGACDDIHIPPSVHTGYILCPITCKLQELPGRHMHLPIIETSKTKLKESQRQQETHDPSSGFHLCTESAVSKLRIKLKSLRSRVNVTLSGSLIVNSFY